MNFLLVALTIILTAGMLFRTSHSVNRKKHFQPEFISGNDEDDSDIKIAGEQIQKPFVDTLKDANELEKQRDCGNLEKARELGAVLSDRIIDEDGECSFGSDSSEDNKTRIQRRMLLAFAACEAVETNIKSRVLQGVVLNVFYDTLKNALPEFYDDINESGSFSFYTLCARRGGDVPHSVGETFAMLGGKEGDRVMEDLGEALYIRFGDVTLKTIESFKFKQ